MYAPRNAWYAAAAAHEVGRTPIARDVVGHRVVLYRTQAGAAVALEDRCAHRPYPLSRGRLDGDRIVSGYSGFVYAPTGECVAVPTQQRVPIGARVRAYPVREADGFVWLWPGTPEVASLRPLPRAPWLLSPEWTTFGGEHLTMASIELLQDNFCDIGHVAVVDQAIAPPVLAGAVTPLEVRISETSVAFWRDFPPAPLAPWHARVLGVAEDATFPQREEGRFVAPGLWVDHWHVLLPEPATFVFTHALTPSGDGTRHAWRVSRNFAPGEEVTQALRPLFTQYYATVKDILEVMQATIAHESPGSLDDASLTGSRLDAPVAADAASSAVRKIMRKLTEVERGR